MRGGAVPGSPRSVKGRGVVPDSPGRAKGGVVPHSRARLEHAGHSRESVECTSPSFLSMTDRDCFGFHVVSDEREPETEAD